MKKLILTVAVFAATAMITNAQITACTPDPAYVPSSPTGAGIQELECARTNVLYNTSTTVVIPTIVTMPIAGNPTSVRICEVRVTNIQNWPTHTQTPNWAIFNQGTQYAAGQWITITDPTETRACVSVEGIFTAPTNPGDSVVAIGDARVSLNPASCASTMDIPFSAIDAANGGLPIGFVVADNCTYGVDDELSYNSFDVAQNYPNPVLGGTQISFTVPTADNVSFRVTNLLGAVVSEQNIAAQQGKNSIQIQSGTYATGMYMYSITYNGTTITKRMVIK